MEADNMNKKVVLENDGYEPNYTWGEEDQLTFKLDPDASCLHSLKLPLLSPYPSHPQLFPVEKREIEGLIYKDGEAIGFLVDNVLSHEESEWYIHNSELIGYEHSEQISPIGLKVLEDSKKTGIPVIWNQPSTIRTNYRVIWQVPKIQSNMIFERIKNSVPTHYVDKHGNHWEMCGINSRFRFFRYGPEQEFYEHHDAACASYNEHGKYIRSFMTLTIYLNDNFTEGQTEFYIGDKTIQVTPVEGTALIFWHDGTQYSPRHSGVAVSSDNCKYILRSDIMFIREEDKQP
eukprot:CAMPEP_0174253252 /NCGR_PEP_ID=MMETSP0439-20130205/2631_1 /TAXON_ID=0 /ORGANISM="Stereomyxa ramosa, Strain Chinc5" /LENGTH=288 /DNA_ID=CAMNT_0015334177 /DNA_START=206 /DNA_END=1072 /DNA_ORIENTATION=+